MLVLQSAEKYSANEFTNIPSKTLSGIEKVNYYKILSQLKLDRTGAEDSALIFLKGTSNPFYTQRTSFALAQYYFKHEQLAKAIPYYESASISNLTNDEIADSKFELAYAYFNSRQFQKAEPLFASIKEVNGKYYLAGNYYYGLLAYNNGKYEEALTSFKRIENEKQYQNIVPYYIAEIYYFMGNRKKALDEASRLIERADKLYYDNELHLLAAQVLFEEQRYGEALPYFEHYYDHTEKVRKEELYEMAYSYYRLNEWKKAIEKFKPLSNAKDSLGQTAMYLLGDCYLKINDKKSARNAFGICADMSFSQGQQEASLLLYGKLSYEMGYNEDAISSLRFLINEFPGSAQVSEAKTWLSDLLIKTYRYADAFDVLQNVNDRNKQYWMVQQKASYGYAMQRLQAGDMHYADSLLSLSLQEPIDKTYSAAAYFWKGDIAYKMNRPANALFYLKQFVNETDQNKVIKLSPDAALANALLTMGYASMNLDEFAEAQNYFARARQAVDINSSISINASIREADAAFMQKNYKDALVLYDKAIEARTTESDYAWIQKSILLGVQGKTNEKINLLQQLINKTPPSKYMNDARYELAVTYIEDEKYQQAIPLLQYLTTDYDARVYASKAWMRLGFAYQELNNNSKAIESYKKVISDFSGSEERTGALEALRSLYIEMNRPEAYAALLKEFSLPAAGSETLDSNFYATAEAQIAAGRWANAKQTLAQYLEKYPNGAFVIRAHYYKAEAHYQLKEDNSALSEFDLLLSLPWNEFSEASAKRAAEIAMRTSNYAGAIKYYDQLRNSAMSNETLQLAYRGLMNASLSSNQFELASNYADTLLSLPDLNESSVHETQFIKAKSLQRQKKYGEALEVYKQLKDVKNEIVASESRYRIAEMLYLNNEFSEAESAAANAIKLNSGNEYWSLKSYLLIVDILVKHKDYFNAKATLQSITKNAKNQELKKEAVQKLDEVKKLEKQQSKLKDE